MRAMTCAAAALVLAFTLGCEDRDRNDAADRVDNAVEETGDAVREGADDIENAADEATDELGATSFERRDEFQQDVRERLDAIDAELADLERTVNEDAADAHVQAVAAAREARQAVERNVERLGGATAETWDELRRDVNESLVTAEARLKELRPEAAPMGGAGQT